MSAPRNRTDPATPVAVAALIARAKLKAICGELYKVMALERKYDLVKRSEVAPPRPTIKSHRWELTPGRIISVGKRYPVAYRFSA
jgi:hypothetical protein